MTLISNNQLQALLRLLLNWLLKLFSLFFFFCLCITIPFKRDAITIDHRLSSYHPRCIKDFILAFLRRVRRALSEDSGRVSPPRREERRREMGLEKDENVLAGGRKRTRGIVQDNEKKIAAKSGRWRKWKRREGQGRTPRPCTVALDCPTVRPVRPERGPSGGPWDQRDGRIADYVHFRFTRMRCAATRISRRGNKLRSQSSCIRARIVGHAGRRRTRAQQSLKSLSIAGCR